MLELLKKVNFVAVLVRYNDCISLLVTISNGDNSQDVIDARELLEDLMFIKESYADGKG